MAFHAREFRSADGTLVPVHLSALRTRVPAADRTLVLHLHGGMERGRDPTRLLATGLCARIAHRAPPRTLVLVPQCPRGRTWLDLLGPLAELVTDTVAGMHVDPRRVALTGVSMGGAGAWALGAERPDLFAVVAPICGPVPDLPGYPARVRRLAATPVWVFHGARDRAVALSNSTTLVGALRAAGGDVRLTVYPDVAHEAWEPAYDDPAFWAFLRRARPRA